MKFETLYNFSYLVTDGYFYQTTRTGSGNILFVAAGRTRPNFAYPENVVALWHVKFKHI